VLPRFAIIVTLFLAAEALPGVGSNAVAQPAETAPLQLEAKIPLGSVHGRIDHMAVDLKRQRLFVAELGNASVGVVDLANRKLLQTIAGLKEPQGVGYEPSTDTLYVANAGDGSVRLFEGTEYKPKGQIELGSDADNVRVDTAANRIFIGYGSGALAVIDPAARSKVGDIPVKAHPEGFEIDPDTSQIFVNVPDAHGIAVVDRASQKQTGKWPIPDHGANFPMALDPVRRQVLVIFRAPAELGVFSMTGGKLIATPMTCSSMRNVAASTSVAGPAFSMSWKRKGRPIGASRAFPPCLGHVRRSLCPNLTVCWLPSGQARPNRQPSGCSDRYLDRQQCDAED
jgi:hypothetical protein